jgi:hypothetical protein
MALFQTNCFRRLWIQRGCASLCLVCYLATALGMPIPTVPHKVSDQPFPCQFHGCGCRSAEQCWGHCCCYTPAERLAWAQAHDVEPPAYAEKPQAQGWSTVRLRDRVEEKTECSCEKCASRERARACCKDEPVKKKGPSRWTLSWAARRCQGLSTTWVNMGAVLPAPPTVTWRPFWPLAGRVFCGDLSFLPAPTILPDPPPRFPLV